MSMLLTTSQARAVHAAMRDLGHVRQITFTRATLTQTAQTVHIDRLPGDMLQLTAQKGEPDERSETHASENAFADAYWLNG